MELFKKIVGAAIVPIFVCSPATAQILPRQPDKPITVPQPQPKIPLELPSNPPLPNDQFPPMRVKRFLFRGNTIIKTNELDLIVASYLNRDITQDDLDKLTGEITQHYTDKGYITSGATIIYGDNTLLNPEAATVTIRVIEGRLGKISVTGSRKLSSYIKQRIDRSKPLNKKKLLEDLNRLNRDELIEGLGVKLLPNPDKLLNRSTLEVSVKPKKTFDLSVFVDNARNTTVGTYEGGISLVARNLTGLGERFSTVYSRASAADLLIAGYILPITPRTSLDFGYAYGAASNILEPFKVLNIKGTSQSFDFGVSRTIISDYTEGESELKLRIGFHRQETQEKILDFSFPVSQGADENGNTFTSSVNLALEYQRIRSQEAYYLRSKFNFGIDLDATTDPAFHNGQYFWWDADAIYSHKLPKGMQFITRLSTQIAANPVIGADLFALGGAYSVRGFRPDSALGDNGALQSLEIKIPVYKGRVGEFDINPFFDIGYVWSNSLINNNSNLIASAGLSLEYYYAQRLSVVLSWGYPLLGNGNSQNLQDGGFLFSFKLDFL